VLNKLQSCSRISALGQEGHCTSRFKRAMCLSCRLHVDVLKGGPDSCGQEGGGSKSWLFCICYKWLTQQFMVNSNIMMGNRGGSCPQAQHILSQNRKYHVLFSAESLKLVYLCYKLQVILPVVAETLHRW